MDSCTEIFKKTKQAGKSLALLNDSQRNELLLHLADKICREADSILQANAVDLSRMDDSNPLKDRLLLTKSRLEGIASDMRNVATLPCPLDRILCERVLPNGLKLRKISVPFGVIGVIYEARPNVTFDVFSLCFKSGNACILKGGKDAFESNTAAILLIKEALRENGLNEDFVNMLPSSHEATAEMLEAVGWIDLVIPRGGRGLIDFVRNNAKVPCIETGAGVVDTYFDKDGDLEMGRKIVNNGKTRRVSVCNALDCLIIHSARLNDLSELLSLMKGVSLYADERAFDALEGKYPKELLFHADADSFGTEWMDYKMSVKTVDSLEQALQHIEKYGSGHSEAIITDNKENARIFQQCVDAACVYVNAPTSFTDGAQFGLGAEIGISTQKLGARGPMGLEEMTSYKWLIEGQGQIRG